MPIIENEKLTYLTIDHRIICVYLNFSMTANGGKLRKERKFHKLIHSTHSSSAGFAFCSKQQHRNCFLDAKSMYGARASRYRDSELYWSITATTRRYTPLPPPVLPPPLHSRNVILKRMCCYYSNARDAACRAEFSSTGEFHSFGPISYMYEWGQGTQLLT